ncbi:MAG: DUF3137 domain-containing protein [bacterium]|nr:DUF3137 domain-containing protein [bacterium]
MQRINYSDFADFFQTKIAPELQPFEEERIKVLRITSPMHKLAIACLVVGFLLLWFTGMFISWLLLGVGVLFICIAGIKQLSYQHKIKETFYPKLYGLLGLRHSESTEAQLKIRDKINLVCKKTGIFNRYDHIMPNDVITGSYNGIPFELSDVQIYYEEGSGKNRHTVYVLEGLFLAIEIEKNYKGETLIKTEKRLQAKEIMGKKAVKLEDVDFEKSFEVYGSDQIESRYLLTTAFMRRLLDYKNKKKCGIEVAFSRETGLHENMFFFIHTYKDHFELPINVSLLNQDLFYSLVKEIMDIMEIVESLKLDQNIGL